MDPRAPEWYRLHYIEGLTYEAIGRKFDTNGDIVSGQVYRYKNRMQREGSAPAALKVVSLGEPLKLSGDFIAIGDVHVPTTDYSLFCKVLVIAAKHLSNPRRLIIGGDWFNMESFSKYEPTVSPPSWAQERDAGRLLLMQALEVFDEVYALQGNHDRRMTKKTAGAIEAKDIYAMLTNDPRLVVSNWGWCTVQTPGGIYRITHSRNYSVNQLTVASELANKFQQHIIGFHEHHLGMGWDRFGRYLVINGGGLFDDSQMAYVQLDDGKNPAMKPGFVMVKGGTPYLFGRPPFTDWARWL